MVQSKLQGTKLIYLYTEQFFLKERLKNFIKKLLGRQARGPQSVALSLFRGLKELGVGFVINQDLAVPIDTACVLGNAKTLAWAIKKKQEGKIKHIIAGPNLVVHARGEDSILSSQEIDIIIVPSLWVYDNYSKDVPALLKKLRVWPAGVNVPPLVLKNRTTDVLLYNKIGNSDLFLQIQEFLQERGLKFKVLNYGQFRQQDFFSELEVAKSMIYLSESESQGLAMFEAWARNVPVLGWERGFWQTKDSSQTGFTATPYLDLSCGDRFKDFEEFKSKLPSFLQSAYFPRRYVTENFSDRVCAQKYLNMLNEIK